MTVMATRDNWLIKAGGLDGKEVLFIGSRGDLTQAMALAALDAQYGKGEFDAWHHGSSLRVSRRAFSHHGAVYQRFSEANEHFWAARKENLPKEEIDRRRELIKKPKEIWKKITGQC